MEKFGRREFCAMISDNVSPLKDCLDSKTYLPSTIVSRGGNTKVSILLMSSKCMASDVQDFCLSIPSLLLPPHI